MVSFVGRQRKDKVRCTRLRKAVRELVRIKQEVFMPLIHWLGEAQVEFGYAC